MSIRIPLIGSRDIRITDRLTVRVPTVAEALRAGEEALFAEAAPFITTGSDMMSELDDLGIDFGNIGDYELFALMFFGCRKKFAGKSLFFPGVSPWECLPVSTDSGTVFMLGGETVIDRDIYNTLSEVFCAFLRHRKTPQKCFGSNYARQKRIELDRAEKKAGNSAADGDPALETAILRLVCCGRISCGFDSIGDMTIYQLMRVLEEAGRSLPENDNHET